MCTSLFGAGTASGFGAAAGGDDGAGAAASFFGSASAAAGGGDDGPDDEVDRARHTNAPAAPSTTMVPSAIHTPPALRPAGAGTRRTASAATLPPMVS